MKILLLGVVFTFFIFSSNADFCSSAFANAMNSLNLLVAADISETNIQNLPFIFAKIRDNAQEIETNCEEDSVEVFQVADELDIDCETSMEYLEEVIDDYKKDVTKENLLAKQITVKLGQVLALLPKVEKSCGLISTFIDEDSEYRLIGQENFENRIYRQENIEEEIELEDEKDLAFPQENLKKENENYDEPVFQEDSLTIVV